jgi:cytochrome P450
MASVTAGPMGASALWDPYTYYAGLRESDPVHWDESVGAWFVTRYDDVVQVLRQPSHFSSRVLSDDLDPFPPIEPSDQALFEHVRSNEASAFVRHDRPEHAAMRRTVQLPFTPTAVERWRPVVRELVKSLLDRLMKTGTMDVVNDLGQPLPFMIVTAMMGLPEGDRAQVRAALVQLLELRGGDPHRFRRISPAISWLETYLGGLIDERHREPADDLLTLLANAERGGTLSREQSVGNAIFLLHAGQATTAALVSNGVLAFIRNPTQWSELRLGTQERIASAVEEVLRYDPSVKAFDRIASTTTRLEGREIKAGQRLYCVIASANRDPRRFAQPETFDIMRSPNPHLAFGTGFHACMGGGLARLEAQEVFTALAERISAPKLGVPESELSYIPAMVLRRLRELPIVWE